MKIIKQNRKGLTEPNGSNASSAADSGLESNDDISRTKRELRSCLDEHGSEAAVSAGTNVKKRRRTEIAFEQQLNSAKKSNVNRQDSEPVSENKKEFNKLLASGMRLLAMREHSEKEMKDKLNAKSGSPSIVIDVVEQLLENSYLCDKRFAESYVRARRNRGFGPVKIRAELKNKGIDSFLVDAHLDPASSQWFEMAEVQYQKKFANQVMLSYSDWTKRARFLQGRGFTMEHIQSCVPNFEHN